MNKIESESNIFSDKGTNIDDVYNKVGGYGKYQLYVTILMIFSYTAGGYLFYGTVYLELYPTYICPLGHN